MSVIVSAIDAELERLEAECKRLRSARELLTSEVSQNGSQDKTASFTDTMRSIQSSAAARFPSKFAPKRHGESILAYLHEHGPTLSSVLGAKCEIPQASLHDALVGLEGRGTIARVGKEGRTFVWGIPGASEPQQAKPSPPPSRDVRETVLGLVGSTPVSATQISHLGGGEYDDVERACEQLLASGSLKDNGDGRFYR